MKWRCEWCGKPHEADDPPCDNCGHGTFEKAVVQEPAANESTTVWVCTECGREHPKHAPPCSRCGNATLERREQTVDDSELVAPGYRDLVTPRYLLGVVVALALGAILLLGVAGVINLPGMDSGVPDVEDVPGNPDTYEGTSLADVETAYLERLNEARREAGAAEFQRDDELDEVARYVNQRFVKARVTSETLGDDDRIGELLAERCGGNSEVRPVGLFDPAPGATAEELGVAIAERQIDEYGVGEGDREARTGVDVHAGPDGALYAMQIRC